MDFRDADSNPSRRPSIDRSIDPFIHSFIDSNQAVTRILPTHTPRLFADALALAREALFRGEVVAMPTETVYGLAAHALDSEAMSKVFRIKGRPAENPIIVHVESVDRARSLARSWPEAADRLAAAFWPGPLTLVVRHNGRVPDIVTARGATVGIRLPAHPFMREIIRACGFPLGAPSANLSNRVSPTTAGHVLKQLEGRIEWIIDGGPCQVGIESTVVDLSGTNPRILRPGMISLEAIRGALGPGHRVAGREPVAEGGCGGGSEGGLRSPGMMEKHYAPKGRLVVREWETELDLVEQVRDLGHACAETCVVAHTQVPLEAEFLGVSIIPNDAEAFGRALYGQLHRCDEEGASLIVIEKPPAAVEWDAIRDRLHRAAAAG